MFKIAYGAGHNNKTSNGIPTSIHKPRVNEWVLNDRVARYFAEAAAAYDVELLRVDDPKGVEPTVLSSRVKKANDWGADFFLSIHHNAGIKGGSGGGLVAYSYKEGTTGAKYRDAIYAACIAAGGLKGDRWDGTLANGFYVIKYTNMPAVLMEYGFMDSTTDVPVILKEEFAKAQAYATMEAIAKVAGLKKKANVEKPAPVAPAEKPAKAEKLVEDGLWGKTTTTRLQKIFGTTVDGLVSNQRASYKKTNPGLVSGWEWETKPNGRGSALIRAMQKWAGMAAKDQDGEIGPKTIRAFQKKLGTYADGCVSNPSAMVKALQKWANSQ